MATCPRALFALRLAQTVWLDRSGRRGCGSGPHSHSSWVARQKGPARPIRHVWEAPMGGERTSVGLDVHARSVSAAAIDGVTGELIRQRLVPDPAVILDWLRALPGPVAVTYEAGPTGFGLARALTGAGIRCQVAAPSKINRPSGDRVKTDAETR